MNYKTYRERSKKCSSLLKKERLDALLLVKPANMFYLTGDGRLCSFAMITQDGEVALGVPNLGQGLHQYHVRASDGQG